MLEIFIFLKSTQHVVINHANTPNGKKKKKIKKLGDDVILAQCPFNVL